MMRSIRGLCVVIVYLLIFSGCANTQPSHFYLLRAMAPSSSQSSLEATHPGVVLGLGPISLPKYLDRPQIVTRITSHEINLAEFHKWAAPLKENISHVLEENLSVLLATDGIVLYPWNRSTSLDYQLTLDIIQLDGKKSQEAELKVRWALVREAGVKGSQKKTSQFSEIVQGPDYEDLVKAMSRMLASLSGEIADAITARSPDN